MYKEPIQPGVAELVIISSHCCGKIPDETYLRKDLPWLTERTVDDGGEDIGGAE